MTIEQAFGNAVRRMRKERGMSQESLALTSKLDRTFISLIECGKKNPTLITIFQLASGLNVSTERILSEVETIMRINGVQSNGKGISVEAEQSALSPDEPPVVEALSKYRESFGRTVLLVDDDELSRKFVKILLDQVGFNVLVAESGPGAIELYDTRRHEISLVIMDVVLPQCNGLEVAQQLWAKYPDSKVLFVSGYDPECLKLPPGKYPFSKKPLDSLHFMNQVRMLLEA